MKRWKKKLTTSMMKTNHKGKNENKETSERRKQSINIKGV